jgi:hypothetical protein
MTRLILGLTVCCGVLCAQPVIFPKGIVNAGSFARPGLPGGAIARGSVFSIFGTGHGANPVSMVRSPNGQFLFVANTGSRFTQINLESNATVRSIPSEMGLQSLGLSDVR